ncbi:MAG: phenylalanine--tRNA ligase subunit alpha [Chloroflexota bacterium]
MLKEIEALRERALRELSSISAGELDAWRVRYLGKKSRLTEVLRGLSALSLAERKEVGALANRTRQTLEEAFKQKSQSLEEARFSAGAFEATIDITIPGRLRPLGRLHPMTQTLNEISGIFATMGFQVTEGPDVEWDYYNFTALNIPEEHAARDTTDTLWVNGARDPRLGSPLLRTHTTSVSARTLAGMKPPIRVVTPGAVYRYEATDATHSDMFHQIDGLAVDRGITMADLKGTLYEFARRFFGEDREVRFRCDFFPFVEPGVEMAIACAVCKGAGCRLCGQSGWIELGGAGMTHPEVLRRGGIDPEEYTRFAFGLGIDRLSMLRYGIDDIRLLYGSDLRFLRQF